MAHRFTIKELARQSGLSAATIDRALHGRAHVSAQTKARVQAAMEELERTEKLVAARGRKLFVDVLVEAPFRFSTQVRLASETAAAEFAPFVIRPRFHGAQVMSDQQMAQSLRLIARRGSHGVCLKAKDVPIVREAIEDLDQRGIPVVTLVTDCRESARIAYVGPDNGAAGQLAARLIAMQAGSERGIVLATQSNRAFEGEDRRLSAFRERLATLAPGLKILVVADAAGLHIDTAAAIDRAVAGIDHLVAVYSMGGANRAIHASLKRHGRLPNIFVAHDLDKDNREMLERGELDIILDHDLNRDMSNVFKQLLAYHGLIAPTGASEPSQPSIIFKENLPS